MMLQPLNHMLIFALSMDMECIHLFNLLTETFDPPFGQVPLAFEALGSWISMRIQWDIHVHSWTSKKCKSPGANWWQRFPWYFHDFVANHVSATTMCMGIHRKETWKDVMRGSQSSYQSVRVHHGCPLRTVQLGNFRETVADWSLNQVRRKQFEIIWTRFVSNKPCYVLLRSENTLGKKTSATSFLWSLVTYRT